MMSSASGEAMKRREVITVLGGAAAAWPFVARAPQNEGLRRIGVLMSVAADDEEGKARFGAFQQGLQQLGWVEGRNVRIDIRWPGAANADDIRKYATELATLAPDANPGHWQLDRGSVATGDSDSADCVRGCPRSGRRRLRCEPGAARRQCYWIHRV